ncbi:hypothetical protein FHX42_002006 [Saccharopolyspora lacisalsi]|uniref:Uncharacterized protein n=1 Tax=Halosaccharopolyspora lacisalsi TaxID=1000566 RepID=A0A839DV67_9PSEU|nr:hypothetical protein [Halosaccharopolyspora lacisalsi]MBA8824659.1 hypothetical protein [Halosaccharopolyspora lacisalsi]
MRLLGLFTLLLGGIFGMRVLVGGGGRPVSLDRSQVVRLFGGWERVVATAPAGLIDSGAVTVSTARR